MVLTSCDRHDLLKPTLTSFFKHNDYLLHQFIIIEDSAKHESIKKVLANFPIEFELICNNPSIGQINSIDKAYAKATGDYIYHCEDDWQFHSKNIIQQSVSVLEKQPKVLSVIFRDPKELENLIDTKKTCQMDNKRYFIIEDEILSFNPSLIRRADYLKVAPYSQYTDSATYGKFEKTMSDLFLSLIHI